MVWRMAVLPYVFSVGFGIAYSNSNRQCESLYQRDKQRKQIPALFFYH